MTTCKFCGEEIEPERHAGWVDARSGDNGGTYDVCPANESGHSPLNLPPRTPAKPASGLARTQDKSHTLTERRKRHV